MTFYDHSFMSDCWAVIRADKAPLACMECGEMGVVNGTCTLCGSSNQEEPFRVGWDESD